MAGESVRALARTRWSRTEQSLGPAQACEQGVEGAEETARVLGSLPADQWLVFHDVPSPGHRSDSLDHVLVGPSGVFVVDSESWSGEIEVADGVLRQDGRKRDRYAVAVADAAHAVGELVPGLEPTSVKPVLCFARDEPVYGWSHDVMVCSTANVTTFLESAPRVLGDTERREIAAVVSTSLFTPTVSSGTPRTTAGGRARPAPSRRAGRRRAGRSRRSRSVRMIMGIGAFVLAAAVAFQYDLPARVGDLGSKAAARVISPTEPIGTTVPVPASGPRPSLTVTAGKPVMTRSKTPGLDVRRGHQLVAVPLTVRNTDDKTWASRSDLVSTAIAADGLSYSSDPAYSRVRGGPVLPISMKLAPGKTRTGLVVFEVPRGARLAKVHLRVGPSLPKTIRWSVG